MNKMENIFVKFKNGLTKDSIFLILFLAIIIPILLFYYQGKNEILKKHLSTTGRIIYYSTIGEANSPSLEYEYFVDGVKFTRHMRPSISKLDSCEKDINLCNKVFFTVIFSPENPEKSLIDLTKQMPYTKNPKPPKELKYFE